MCARPVYTLLPIDVWIVNIDVDPVTAVLCGETTAPQKIHLEIVCGPWQTCQTLCQTSQRCSDGPKLWQSVWRMRLPFATRFSTIAQRCFNDAFFRSTIFCKCAFFMVDFHPNAYRNQGKITSVIVQSNCFVAPWTLSLRICCQLMAAEGNPNLSSEGQLTPLMLAASNGHEDTCRLLWNLGQ